MKPVRWIHKLKADPRPKLFGYRAPGPVRAQALRLLEDRQDDDFLLKHALRDAGRYEPRVVLLDTWRPDGSWGIDRLFMRTYGEAAASDKALVETIKNLALLHLYCWRDEGEYIEGYLEKAKELILSRAQPDGSLKLVSDESLEINDKERPEILPPDHWVGTAAAILLRLGVEDQRIDRLISWLEVNQRFDGGWLPEIYKEQYREKEDAGSELPSHPLSTACFAQALIAHPQSRREETARRAIECLLSLSLPSTRLSTAGLDMQWERLAEPQWGFDTLKLLHSALDAGFDLENEGVVRLANRVVGLQLSSGLWRSSRKRPEPDEDLFLTLSATVALKKAFESVESKDSHEG